MNRRADVQGMRAVAILLVVAFHAGLPVEGGFAGVDMFFVISGFVIGRLLLAEIEQTERVALAAFYGRRVRRLLPALAVMAVLVVLAGTLLTVGDRTADIASSAVATVLGVSNVWFYTETGGYFDVPDGEVPLLHAWTLAVEAQFYLVAPIALLLVWRVARRRSAPFARRAVFATAAVALVASFALAAMFAGGFTAGGRISDPQSLAFYGFPTRAWEFLAGVLIAGAEPRLGAIRRRGVATAIAGFGVVLLVAIAGAGAQIGAVPALGVLPAVAGTAALIVGGVMAPENAISRALALPWLTWIGDRSYSWYLWHWPLIVFGVIAVPDQDLRVPLAIVSLAPAWLSYRYVEQPGLRVRAGIRTTVVALASVVAVVAAGSAAARAQERIADSAGISGLSEALDGKALVEAGECRDDTGQPWVPTHHGVARCLPATVPGAGRILLVGDSQADAYGYGLREVARKRGMALDAVVRPACLASPMTWPPDTTITGDTGCSTMPDDVAAAIEAEPPKLLVIAQSATLRAFVDGKVALTDEQLTAAHTKALRTLVGRARAAGSRVLILRNVPVFSEADASECATAIRLIAGSTRLCLKAPRTLAERYARGLPMWQSALAVHASRFDPSDAFCTATVCSQVRKGHLAYRNGNHLSVQGVLDLTGELEEAVAKAMRG